MSAAPLQAIQEPARDTTSSFATNRRDLEAGPSTQEPHDPATPIASAASNLGKKLCYASIVSCGLGLIGLGVGLAVGCMVKRQLVMNSTAMIVGSVVGACVGGVIGWNLEMLIRELSTQAPTTPASTAQTLTRQQQTGQTLIPIRYLDPTDEVIMVFPDRTSATWIIDKTLPPSTANQFVPTEPENISFESGARMDVDEAEVPPHLLRAHS